MIHETPQAVEAVARAICQSRDLSPDCLYQHNFEGDWPEDDRRDYQDPFTGEPRTMLFHKAWRRWEAAARAAIAAIATPPPAANEHAELIEPELPQGTYHLEYFRGWAAYRDALQALSVASPREVELEAVVRAYMSDCSNVECERCSTARTTLDQG